MKSNDYPICSLMVLAAGATAQVTIAPGQSSFAPATQLSPATQPADAPGAEQAAHDSASTTPAASQPLEGLYEPHKMLDASVHGREACLLCHLPTFTPDLRGTRTGHAGLRAESISLCAGCHSQHIDYFEPGHIGLTVTPAIKARLTRSAASSQPADRPLHRSSTRLPLGEGDRIVCVTCHNPHPRGLFPTGSEMSEGAMSDDSSNPLALRGPAKDVCRVCHPY